MSDNTGIWLPEAVLGLADLSPTEKMLFAAILPMTFTEPCWAGNEYLAKRIGVSEQTVTNNLGTLHNKGYIRIYLDRNGGTTRKIHTYILEDTLYKYVGHPISKLDTPLYKDFIQGISKSYIGCIKSLSTLYKDFIFTYKDDSKEDKKEESKEESKYKKVKVATAPFWSVLKSRSSVYQSWKSYSLWTTAEREKIKFPSRWNKNMIDFYNQNWLPFRQKEFSKKLKPSSIQQQIETLSPLGETQLINCIKASIANGWQGLFPERYLKVSPPSSHQKQVPNDNAVSYSDLIDHQKVANLKQAQARRDPQPTF